MINFVLCIVYKRQTCSSSYHKTSLVVILPKRKLISIVAAKEKVLNESITRNQFMTSVADVIDSREDVSPRVMGQLKSLNISSDCLNEY